MSSLVGESAGGEYHRCGVECTADSFANGFAVAGHCHHLLHFPSVGSHEPGNHAAVGVGDLSDEKFVADNDNGSFHCCVVDVSDFQACDM